MLLEDWHGCLTIDILIHKMRHIMFEYLTSSPLLSGMIWGALLWGTLYTVLGLVFKDHVAKKMGFWTLFLSIILIIIA